MNREEAIEKTTKRVLGWVHGRNEFSRALPVADVLSETLYFERLRLKGNVHAPGGDADRSFWRAAARDMQSADAHARLLERIVTRYADEIVGHFSPTVFSVLTHYAAPALSLMLNSTSPLQLRETLRNLQATSDNVTVGGQVEAFLSLAKRGTIILVPTHVSNMDSVVLGFALARLGLPPFLYGAGYNLFKNPLLSPFLKRLGAYTVDREKKAPLYKQTLKNYAVVSMENGEHHIFFPGGTRSRSGRIETKLKKGLLGCGLQAYAERLESKHPRPDVFIVPCTMTYPIVLEAETLIEDYLAEAGKSRYIIVDDESSRLVRVSQFMSSLLRHESRIHIEILPALDPFGNRVLPDGTSIDAHDRPIDIAGYLKRDGALTRDAQRDEEFTRELEERLVKAYPRGTVVSPTHIVALLLFDLLEEEHPEWDLYRLLKGDEAHPGFAIETVRVRLSHLLARLAELQAEGALELDALVAAGEVDDILSRALVHFTVYHATPVAERRGMRLFALHRPLIYYYRNRLAGYDFGTAAGGRRHGEW